MPTLVWLVKNSFHHLKPIKEIVFAFMVTTYIYYKIPVSGEYVKGYLLN